MAAERDLVAKWVWWGPTFGVRWRGQEIAFIGCLRFGVLVGCTGRWGWHLYLWPRPRFIRARRIDR